MANSNSISPSRPNAQTAFFVLLATLLLLLCPLFAQRAYAADDPESVMLQVANDNADQINVVKDVASLDSQKKDTKVTLTVKDAYTNNDASERTRELVLMDASGNTTKQLTSSQNDTLEFSIGDLVEGQRMALITSAKDNDGETGQRYQKTLNVRLVDTTKAETPFSAGSNSSAKKEGDGWQWSFSNGLEYTFRNTGFSFLNDTKMSLGALKLPLKFKHNTDGTTIVGINCSPEDKAFWSAIKNKNVWQKYSTEKMAEMTKQMDKGFSGKNFGKWGGKAFDWNIFGYMEFNTQKPEAPRALNLVLSAGVKAEGHAQYLIFTGSITFTLGGKATISGKLIPAKGLEGNFGLGVYGGLELYVGLGLQYVASVGGYGNGRLDIDFQILPSFYLDKIKLSGQLGAKAKVFGFTVYTWTILDKEKMLYEHAAEVKKTTTTPAAVALSPAFGALLSSVLDASETLGGGVAGPPTAQGANQNAGGGNGTSANGSNGSANASSADPSTATGSTSGQGAATNSDGTATSPFNVSANESYPLDSRDYLQEEATEAERQDATQEKGSVAAEQAGTNVVTTQATKADTTILKGIYGEAEPVCATTNDGPVIVYVADAAQVTGGGSRDDANRSVLAYTRFKNGSWTNPKVIDNSPTHKDYADYSPTVTTDGSNCYVAWLAAKDKVNAISDKASIGQLGKMLDVNMATIASDDTITVQTVHKESDNNNTMPAGAKAVKVGNDLYVGFYTNQTSGNNSEVLGMSGTHNVRLFKQGASNTWTEVASTTTENGAITSFDVGAYGGTVACAWSLDSKLSEKESEEALSGVSHLESSAIYTLTTSKSDMHAMSATNAQFAKQDGTDVLTYAQQVSDDEQGIPYLNILSFSSPEDSKGTVILDGKKVDLPTSHYKLTGDLGKNKEGNVSFLVAGNGSSDIKAIITTGTGNDSWTNIMEATVTDKVITNYCATYVDGLPKFIYLEEESASSGVATEAADDGSANLNQTTEDSLKHLSIDDLDYDEYAVRSGQKMPVTVRFENDGMLDIDGVDAWLMENGELTKVSSEDISVPLDDEASLTFDYTIPHADTFTDAHEFTVYVAPKNAMVTNATIERAKTDGSAMTTSLGGPSLALDANHQIVNDKESVTATITNDGIASHGAKLIFLNAESDEMLASVDVPELSEGAAFSYTYSAPNDFFQNDGVEAIIVTLENDGSENEGYELNNTEFIDTWDVKTYGTETPANNSSTGTTRSALPRTADPTNFATCAALLVAAQGALLVALRFRRS